MSSPERKIRRFWETRARLNIKEASRFHSEHTSYDQAAIASLVTGGMRVLDLGCGTCVLANWLVADYGAAVHGVDSQSAFLSHAITSPLLTTEQADLTTYRPTGSFDLVLLFGVINHLIDARVRESLYERLVDVVSDNGCLLIKNQFGINSCVEIDKYSDELRDDYYSLYPHLDEEVLILSRLFDITVYDPYPKHLSPFGDTHFYHLLARKPRRETNSRGH